ncbi:uncharacterized protein N7443_006408 [Penicillium atrosanguineum]|uniref:uncharacterized protein n=1 Tax=Penicillium atrosanguineum TaxID=1132637 RepID=UPI0023A15F94|nr:uncharacterized protein N7443_006408 [Penicillium atrosanguineum]KAJ5298288.1 hypothetical protein N7443_006408 [Penicillium atrosanguineum]
MFYSHEILTSPDHGVATIWLVATLGSRSIARRINRRAIQDVDVPSACRVIIDPESPMALRLQGSLLYGVSRIFNQQCGYTLLDAQTMHDKMMTMLRIVPGAGLDPSAGKSKPGSLNLPYDPTFLPETGLPGMGIDVILLDAITDEAHSQYPSIWSKSPAISRSSGSQNGQFQLELPLDELIGGNVMAGQDDINDSAQRIGLFGRKTKPSVEESVLLNPDFEFDDNGDIVEFDASRVSPNRRRGTSFDPRLSEGPNLQKDQGDTVLANDEAVLVRDDNVMDLDVQPGAEVILPGVDVLTETVRLDRSMENERRLNQRQREAKIIVTDVVTTLRNTDLARWNSEYEANMAQAAKQKQLNKLPTIAKKNAAYWVLGKGIGAVGNPLGPQHIPHPLKSYSGEELYYALCPEAERKRRRTEGTGDDSDSGEQSRQVRPREGQVNPMDVEIARHAPSSVLDDHSSLMPWNTIVSIESSHRGQRFRSGSEISYGSRRRGRIQSASPLAGRGYRDRDSSLDISGNFGDDLDDFEITRYLEAGLSPDKGDISEMDPRKINGEKHIAKMLDQGTLNFWDFLKDKMLPSKGGRIEFETLLPPKETSRTVATQAFMNALTLATKGAISVGQEPFQDQGPSSWGIRYQYGKLWLGVAQQQ